MRVFDLKTGDGVLRRNVKNVDRKSGKMEAKWM